MSVHGELDPRMTAGLDLLHRTGANSFQIRYSDDEEPTVWFVVAFYERDGKTLYETAAALRPEVAVFRLCAELIDGGVCTHCNRPSGFSEDPDALPVNEFVCWYQWDPELKKFRRGCEGD